MRTLIIGGPRCGKSTYAATLGVPHFCTDTIAQADTSIAPGATYLPHELGPRDAWSLASAYIASTWFSLPDPWVIEGARTVHALRKWRTMRDEPVADEILLFHRALDTLTPGQASLSKSVWTIWNEISPLFTAIPTFDIELDEDGTWLKL